MGPTVTPVDDRLTYISRERLYHLVYVSRSLVGPLDKGGAAVIGDILAASILRNDLLGVTGR